MKPLRILCWNTFLMPWITQPETHHVERAKLIGTWLLKKKDQFDVIVLIKTFNDARRPIVVDMLRPAFPYVTEPTDFGAAGDAFNSGITILSKIGFKVLLRHDWKAAAGFEAMEPKGFIILEGSWEGVPFQLVPCHMQGHVNDTSLDEKARYAQILELKTGLERFQNGKVTQIVCGDFAIKPGTIQYNYLRTELQLDDSASNSSHWSTNTTTRALFPTVKNNISGTELSDFVFLRNSSPKEIADTQRGILDETRGEWLSKSAGTEYLSYKIPVYANVTLQPHADKPASDPSFSGSGIQSNYLSFYKEKHERNYNKFEVSAQSNTGMEYGLVELKRIVQIAAQNGKTVRAWGSGHSFSSVARAAHSSKGSFLVDMGGGVADVVAQKPTGINGISLLDSASMRFSATWIKANLKAPNRLVELGAGTTIKELNQGLEKLGFGLINMGTYNGQTFAGASSTSTHGSGIGLPPFPDAIRSLVLVSLDENAKARAYRIEPSSGPTDMSKFKSGEIDELIQNDDVFYSVICAMGCFGLLHSFVIEVQPFYYLKEKSELCTWSEIRSAGIVALKAKVLAARHFEMVVAPYPETEVALDLARFKNEVAVLQVWRDISELRAQAGVKRSFHVAALEGVADFLSPEEHVKYGNCYLSDYRTDTPPWPIGVGGKDYPFKIAGLHSPIGYNDKYYDVFRQGGHVIGGYAIELTAPLDMAIDVMDRIQKVTAANRARGWMHSGMIGVRFVGPSKAYMSQFYNQPSVTFEVTMLRGTPNGFNALRAVQDAFLSDPKVRLHWGLTMVRDEEQSLGHPDARSLSHWRARFPKFDTWYTQYQRFNKHKVFSNRLTEWMGLDGSPSAATLDLKFIGHVQDFGDLTYTQDALVGTEGQSRRLEGFQIDFVSPIAGLGLRYMAHLAELGDTAWTNNGTFVGTRSQYRRLEGFAIELTGSAASSWEVLYMAHLADTGNTGWCKNGEFCGTRGLSRAVEGIRVLVRKK